MEAVYEAVVTRLAMLGYTVTDDDKTGLEYTIRKCEAELLANINHRELPPPLFYTLKLVKFLLFLFFQTFYRCQTTLFGTKIILAFTRFQHIIP